MRHGHEKTTSYPYKNVYLCDDCGCGWVSADMEKGTTPFIVGCIFCGGHATSLFYNIPQSILVNKPARMEWYVPGAAERKTLGCGSREHVNKGGLLPRIVPIPPQEDIDPEKG